MAGPPLGGPAIVVSTVYALTRQSPLPWVAT